MDIRKLQRAIVDGLEDVKAQNIVVFNTEHLSPLFERVIIASGNSNRQTKALASSVRDAVKSSGFPVMRTEGEDNGEWIIVDCGAAVAHIMQPAVRDYYHLEEIWGSKPVRMKFGGVAPTTAKATPASPRARSAVAEAASPPARKRASAPSGSAASKKVAAKPNGKTAPARPAATKAGGRPPAKKTPASARVERTTGVKSARSTATAKDSPVRRKTATGEATPRAAVSARSAPRTGRSTTSRATTAKSRG